MTSLQLIKKELPAILLVIAPFVALAILWNEIPDRIPNHWGLDGKPDGFGSRNSILTLPLLLIGLYAFFFIFPKIDPKQKTGLRQKPIPAIKYVSLVVLSAIFYVQLAQATGRFELSSPRIIPFIVLVMILLLGNYMKTVQPNYFVGIKTPWTLEDPDVWRDTHRFGGWLWVITSAILLLLWTVLPAETFAYALGVGIVLFIFPPIIYSYVLFRRKQNGAANG